MSTLFYQQHIQQPTFVSVVLFSALDPSTLRSNSKPLFSTPITLSVMNLFTSTAVLLLAALAVADSLPEALPQLHHPLRPLRTCSHPSSRVIIASP